MRHGRNERNRNKNRARHQCGRESERHKICAHLFSTLDSRRVFFFVVAYHLPLGTTATLPVHSQPLVGDFFGLPTSSNCVVKHLSVWFFLHVKTLNVLIPTCKFLCPCRKLRHFLLSPRRSCAYLVRTLLLKTRLSFAQLLAFLHSTRCSFRSLLEQHHVSTKWAQDEVTLLHEYALRNVNLFLPSFPVVPSHHKAGSVEEQILQFSSHPNDGNCLSASLHLDYRNGRSPLRFDLLSHSLSSETRTASCPVLVGMVCVSDVRLSCQVLPSCVDPEFSRVPRKRPSRSRLDSGSI